MVPGARLSLTLLYVVGIIDGVFCLLVRVMKRAAMVRLDGSMATGEREDMEEARLLIVSRTVEIDDSRVGIGAILRRPSAW